MKATLLAKTVLTDDARRRLDIALEDVEDLDAPLPTDMDRLAEIAGRLCYRSEHRPNAATRRNRDYLANVLGQGHESVVSHAAVTFLVEEVSRALTHELIRHRWLSFSQESQRYVALRVVASLRRAILALIGRPSPIEVEPVYPPAADRRERARLRRSFRRDLRAYGRAVKGYERRGLARKQAREAARAHLPNATPTAVVVSGNLRAWRDFLRQRLSPYADAEIRALALAVLWHLADLAPHTFADAEEWMK